MGNTEITVKLTKASIDEAIKKVEKYRKSFDRNVNTFRKEIARYIASEASPAFNSAVADDIVGGFRTASVSVSYYNKGNVTVVLANGADAVWVEFGSGVINNGAVGSSPNPWGKELGFAIGTYGKGNGKKETWGYVDGGDIVLTHGTPAAMPLYRATKKAIMDIVSIAREVWK